MLFTNVKIPESVKDNGKITSETAPDNSSKSDNENKDIPDNLSDQNDYLYKSICIIYL
jgi:hypothetical protein